MTTNTLHEDSNGIQLLLTTLVLVSGPVLKKKNVQFICASGFTTIVGINHKVLFTIIEFRKGIYI